MMLVDFPNYSRANPWQIKTIQTCAPMEVRVTNKLGHINCYALHISWEDALLRGANTLEKANQLVVRFEEYLKAQSKRSKIIWTVHNLTSHTCSFRDAEKDLRAVIMEYASVINLMSVKHCFIIPKKHQSKINIVPHYIEKSRFSALKKNEVLTYFKYGADRGRKDNRYYLKLLNSGKVRKFVSDARLNMEIDTAETVITKRRFTFIEADLYAQLSNFSTFYQPPKFNSGVINFLIGCKVAIFHDIDTVRYMELPESFKNFCLDLNRLESKELQNLESMIKIDHDDLDEFISQRCPKNVSIAFWRGVIS